VEEKEKEDIVIESVNSNADSNSDSNKSNSESENIYFNPENEDDNPENEEFVTEDNSDSDSEDESDPDKEPEVILRRSGRETRKANDPLRNINTTKGQSYTNIKKCVKTKKSQEKRRKEFILVTKNLTGRKI